jgi:hypothetical protein
VPKLYWEDVCLNTQKRAEMFYEFVSCKEMELVQYFGERFARKGRKDAKRCCVAKHPSFAPLRETSILTQSGHRNRNAIRSCTHSDAAFA